MTTEFLDYDGAPDDGGWSKGLDHDQQGFGTILTHQKGHPAPVRNWLCPFVMVLARECDERMSKNRTTKKQQNRAAGGSAGGSTGGEE